MAKKRVKASEKESNDKIIFAFLATFLSIVGFVIALIVKRNDKYVIFYAKQSLVIFILGTISGIIGRMLLWIPIMGFLISSALGILIFIIWLFSWIHALSGKEISIPIVNYWADKIKL